MRTRSLAITLIAVLIPLGLTALLTSISLDTIAERNDRIARLTDSMELIEARPAEARRIDTVIVESDGVPDDAEKDSLREEIRDLRWSVDSGAKASGALQDEIDRTRKELDGARGELKNVHERYRGTIADLQGQITKLNAEIERLRAILKRNRIDPQKFERSNPR